MTRRLQHRKHHVAGESFILFSVGECTFAIAASAVSEIQSLNGLRAAGSHGKVRHTLLREGKRYFVVDANYHYHLLPTRSTRVLLLSCAPVAVKVDEIERMAEVAKVEALPQSFSGDERRWYRGLAVIAGKVIPVVNPESFLNRFELSAMESSEAVVARNEIASRAVAL